MTIINKLGNNLRQQGANLLKTGQTLKKPMYPPQRLQRNANQVPVQTYTASFTNQDGVSTILHNHKRRKELITHPTLKILKTEPLAPQKVEFIASQWYLPVENFTGYLGGLIQSVPPSHLELQTFAAKILWQESGEGNPENSHANLFLKTLELAGFNPEVIQSQLPERETLELVQKYNQSNRNFLDSLGVLYGTEVADLSMVEAIGTAIRKCPSSIQTELPWVDIHLKQEPDHVDQVNQSVGIKLESSEQKKVISGAEELWGFWIKFFDMIGSRL